MQTLEKGLSRVGGRRGESLMHQRELTYPLDASLCLFYFFFFSFCGARDCTQDSSMQDMRFKLSYILGPCALALCLCVCACQPAQPSLTVSVQLTAESLSLFSSLVTLIGGGGSLRAGVVAGLFQ